MARGPNFEKERVLNEDELAQLRSKLAHLSESGVQARVPGLRDHRRAFSNGDLDPTARHGVEAVAEVVETATAPLVLRNCTGVPFPR